MRISYLAGMIVGTLIFFSRIVAVAREVIVEAVPATYHAVTELIMLPFRIDYGAARHAFAGFVLAAFRLIGMLKPEYDESLETDGQNFVPMHRLGARC